MLLQLLLFTATAGSAAALAPYPPRRRCVARRVLEDEAIETLGDLGALDDAAVGELDLDALVAGAGLTVASTTALADAGGAVPALGADLSKGRAVALGAEAAAAPDDCSTTSVSTALSRPVTVWPILFMAD